MARFLTEFPFDQNVFCMTRYPTAEVVDPVERVIDVARVALRAHGLVLHLASDRSIDDDLWGNVAAHCWACRYGLALFENRLERGLNHNLVAEVGAMLATGRRCGLLKDRTQPDMPTDFIGQIYRPVDFDDEDAVHRTIHEWADRDLGLGPCAECAERPTTKGRSL